MTVDLQGETNGFDTAQPRSSLRMDTGKGSG